MLFGHGFYSPFGTKMLFVEVSSKTEAFPYSSRWMCWLILRGTHFSTSKIIFPLPHQDQIPQVAVTFPPQTGHSNVTKTKAVGLSMLVYERKVCNRHPGHCGHSCKAAGTASLRGRWSNEGSNEEGGQYGGESGARRGRGMRKKANCQPGCLCFLCCCPQYPG